MKTYIQIRDGKPIDFPILEEHLMYLPEGSRVELAEVVHSARPQLPWTQTCEEFPVYDLGSDGRAYERWIVREWTPEERASFTSTSAEYLRAASGVRGQRNKQISASDWTQLSDARLTDEQRAAWSAYRQALRDVPEQPGFPWQVTWPIAP